MRDIRPDLHERLSNLEKEREKLSVKLEAIDDAERSISALIMIENARWESTDRDQQPSEVIGSKNSDGTPLTNVLMGILRGGDWFSVQQLAEAAVKKGFPFGSKAPGRAIHFALIGMMRSGSSVERNSATRQWRLLRTKSQRVLDLVKAGKSVKTDEDLIGKWPQPAFGNKAQELLDSVESVRSEK